MNSSKIDIYSMEKGCELLKEASNKLKQVSNKMLYLKDFYTKETLKFQDTTMEGSIDNCTISIEKTVNCIEDYVEDFQLALNKLDFSITDVKENNYE